MYCCHVNVVGYVFDAEKGKAVMKKVSEVSRLAGVSRRTLQYYDNEGVIKVKRTKNNYRMYDQMALRKLWELMMYKEMGWDLKCIKQILRMTEDKRDKWMYLKIRKNRNEILKLQQQNEFIMWIAENGMPPMPEESNDKTYLEQISLLKNRVSSRRNENYNYISDIDQLRKRLDEAYQQLQLGQLRYAIYDTEQVMKEAMKMLIKWGNGEEWDEDNLMTNIKICERRKEFGMESGMIQKLNKVRCICEYAKEIFEADKLLDYDKVRFAIMQTKDLLNYIEKKITV